VEQAPSEKIETDEEHELPVAVPQVHAVQARVSSKLP
jgi:hypothetical protein